MEKSLSILQQIRVQFECKEVDIKTYSPLTLAYIGDGIFDMVIRSIVVDRGNTSANQLHQHTSHIVKAATQAKMMNAIMGQLSDEERDVYRRGRNAKSHTMAKNASMSDYRNATGFEALMGYLYLTDQLGRIMELVKEGIEQCNLKV